MVAALALASSLSGCSPKGEEPAPTTTKSTQRELARGLSGCMKDKGWQVSANEDVPGEINLPEGGIPEDQIASFDGDFEVCKKAIGYVEGGSPDREEALLVYEHAVKTAKCLEGQGYAIKDVAAKETFVQNYLAGEYQLPYMDVPDMSPERLAALEKICPQSPPEIVG